MRRDRNGPIVESTTGSKELGCAIQLRSQIEGNEPYASPVPPLKGEEVGSASLDRSSR